MIRAFLGLALPDAIKSALTVQQFLLPLPRKVNPDQFHLTLVFLGEVPDHVLEAAHDGFASLRQAPFSLSLQGLGLFGGNRPRAAWAGVAPSAPLASLQARTERLALQAGCPVEVRRFHPHVTLGRFPPPALPLVMPMERAIAEGASFAAGPWQVTEMILWESHMAQGRHGHGPRYDELARYAFA